MEASAAPETLRPTRGRFDKLGDKLTRGVTGGAAIISVALVLGIGWVILSGAWPAIKEFGVWGFISSNTWNYATDAYGARDLIIETVVTSFGALLLAGPIAIAISLFLSELAPAAIRGPIGTLIDMLAAVPSVVIGLWGIIVLVPFSSRHIEPWLHDHTERIPGLNAIFATPASGAYTSSIFNAILILTIMIIPITSAICRELFLGVPSELEQGAVGLGATRWEMVRGVVVPSVKGGVVAALILGLGRALGEAIAVTQVIGNRTYPMTNWSLFETGDTLASRIANAFAGAQTDVLRSSLVYLGLILLVISFITNFTAQRIIHRFDKQHSGA